MGNDIEKSLQASGIKFVRILWCDNANVIRAKAVRVGTASPYLANGVGISVAQQAVPVMYDAPILSTGLGPVGEVQLRPDWPSFTPLPYVPGHGRVFGDMYKHGQPWDLCPRQFLKRQVQRAAEMGFQVIAAFENEFYLLQRTAEGKITPVDRTLFASTQAMDLNHAVIDEIADALVAQGMPVEQYYPESGCGQHEISILYTDAVAAADQQIAFRETVKAIASHHQLTASFLPKIFPDQAGSGCHLHISLWQDGENLLPDPAEILGLSPLARHFIGGILHHNRALMALTTPSPNSYRRLRPHCWSGAYRCWGGDNREASIRVPSDSEGTGSSHFEFKTVDASSNPHIALGSVIAAGLDGVTQKLEPGEPVNIDPGYLSEAERQARNIDRLPETLGDAIIALQEDSVLLSALGESFAQAYLAVRQAEWEAMKDMSLEEEVELLLERY